MHKRSQKREELHGGNVGTDQREQVWNKTQGRCWYCGMQTTPWGNFTVDHVDPRKQGGGDELANLVPCCKTCNSRKNSKTVEEFRGYLIAKQRQMFWFEHANMVTTKATKNDDSLTDEACEICEATDGSMREVGWYAPYFQDPIMLTLIGLAYLAANWGPDLGEIAQFTHQKPTTVLAHLFRLHNDGVVRVHWHDQVKVYWYFINDLEASFLQSHGFMS